MVARFIIALETRDPARSLARAYVRFRFEHRRKRGSAGIEIVAAYEFLTGDWSPWPMYSAISRRWTNLSITLHPYYGEVLQGLTSGLPPLRAA